MKVLVVGILLFEILTYFSARGSKCLVSKGEIGIVLDGTCEQGEGFDKIIDVLKNLVKDFTVSEKGKRFSFMTYRELPNLKNVFVDDRYESTNSYLQLLDATRCIQGDAAPKLELALITARNMFSQGGGARDVKRRMILITHSRQNITSCCGMMKELVKWFKEKNVEVMVVSIGNKESVNDLKVLASKEENVFKYDGIDGFVAAQTSFSTALCKSIQVPGCPPEMMMGLLPDHAPKSCKELLKVRPSTVSGVYWIKPTDSQALQVYCDMKMSGGGWTLVYSYTFTAYSNFRSARNGVTPQPTWPTIGNVARSSSPPLSETHYAALDFPLWKHIGHEFVIKSNINHWIQCNENTGSLVDWKSGSIKCHVIKNVADKCHDLVPDTLKFNAAGDRGTVVGVDLVRAESRSKNKEYYYFESSTKTNWPTHDPCGTNGLNHVKGVTNPHGNIYIR